MEFGEFGECPIDFGNDNMLNQMMALGETIAASEEGSSSDGETVPESLL